MHRNGKYSGCCYFSPFLRTNDMKKIMSMVKQKRKKKVFVCPHLLTNQTHHLRDFTPKFQKGGNGKSQIFSIRPSWKLLFLLTAILFLQQRAFPSQATPAPQLTPSICKQTYLSFFFSKASGVKGRDANKLMTAASLRKCLESRVPPECSRVLMLH